MNVVSYHDADGILREARQGGLKVFAYMAPVSVHFSDGRIGSFGVLHGMYVEGPQEKEDRENFYRGRTRA